MRFSDFWSTRGRVTRGQYAAVGLGLGVLKYGLDAGAIYLASGKLLSPLAYLNPLRASEEGFWHQLPTPLLWLMALWTLPFLWIGFVLSVRRAVDAGMSPWWGALFLVPILNYLAMAAFCFIPSAPGLIGKPSVTAEVSKIRAAAVGLILGLAYGIVVYGLTVYALKAYGAALFVGTPVMMGAIGGFRFARDARGSLAGAIGVAVLAALLALLSVLLLALEGAICVIMAALPAVLAAGVGGICGWVLAQRPPPAQAMTGLLLLVMPVLSGFESRADPSELIEVVSAVEIDAPPEVVWQRVVAFPELSPPTEALFRAGIAYPQRATISGSGVGAIRRCEFSTGAFVEPITRWDAPRTLSFDVAEQPRPMEELSPYGRIDAPHLDGYFRSVKGEFRLVPTGGGRTRLEGSTWYELRLFPVAYWRSWADAIVHQIHLRVLRQIKAAAEG
ncbi:MAG TPA: DUF805 domain-containing protein [Myxococcaceae bacterium]|nr:DUF805 domain-containing protein [Myxococcaceae bacterium]